MPVGEIQPWKTVAISGRATVSETVVFEAPDVRAPTAFVLRLYGQEQESLGQKRFFVYPFGLMSELSKLPLNSKIGILDPRGIFRPSLAQVKLEISIRCAENLLHRDSLHLPVTTEPNL